MKNLINLFIIAAVAMVMVLSCGHSSQAAKTDSAISQKSEEPAAIPAVTTPSYNSPDLAFFDLLGKVKSCVIIKDENEWDTPQNISFNEKGTWTNIPSWDEMEIQMFPELKKLSKYEKNNSGYIIAEHEVSDMEHGSFI